MDGTASTKAEADAELRQLREQRGAKGNELRDSALVSSLNQALNILSDQLYQTPTHFLLELIQNADDNSYGSEVVPSLHLSLYEKDGQKCLRTDCNEVGFTFKQLDALTRVGQSTKKSTSNGRKGYIGEKGIGFKSVFKVADVVHVASGFYEFRLDRNELIGMILPILSRFPSADRVANHTQFLLHLKYMHDYREIQRDLENVEPQVLMFLRKLKKVHISTPGADRVYQRRITKHERELGGETVTISKRNDREGLVQNTKYVVHRHTVRELGPDSRKEGVTASEVVVAFAVKDQVTPIATIQKAFAFLPIDNFGFRFLIHADFLLVASRESLEYNCPWNLALRDGIRDAFVAAINRFVVLKNNEDKKGLRYTWPKYLPRQPGTYIFWYDLHQSMLDALRDENILESRDEDAPFQMPRVLRFVPEDYRFDDGTLFNLPSIHRSHLSFAYDDVREQLSLIGVSTLTLEEVCREFDKWIRVVGVTGIEGQSVQWHRNVSSLFYGRTYLKTRLRKFPIIPLRDSSWTKAEGEHVYLASQNEDEHVPAGVNIRIVDQDASQDPTRRRFFKFLGIKEYSPRQVCDLILELHQNLFVDRRGRTRDALIADAAYLFKHRSQLNTYGAPGIFFVVMKDGWLAEVRSTLIYLVDPTVQPPLIAKYRNIPGNPFSVLVDGYETAICEGRGDETAKEFREWLLRSTESRFATVPTLISGTILNPEWWFLRDRDVVDLLHAVKFHWKHTHLPLKLLKAVPELKVPCLDGVTRTLGLLAVPTTDLKKQCPHLDFARLPEPTLENWGFLSEFAVITACCTTARLRELEALSKLPIDSVDKKAVHEIYRRLSSCISLDDEEIQTAFRKSPLVFITKPKRRWLSHQACVWSAPALLKQVIKLKARYEDCQRLFCNLLGVKPASTKHIVDEFCSMDGQEVQQFEELLSLLSRFHSQKSSLNNKQIKMIQSAPVFPILEKGDQSQGESSLAFRSVDEEDWYIPDTAILESAFRGKVDMLHLPVKSVRMMKDLFETLGCEDMFLSSAVEEVVEPSGTSIRDKLREDELNIRLKYIYQLTPESSELIDFPLVQVWSVPSVTVTRCLGNVEVRDDNELVTIKENEDTVDVYLREGIQESDQSMVNYKLVDYFDSEFGIDDEYTNLVNLLMNAPTSQLANILEMKDIPLPEDSDSEDLDGEESDSEDDDTAAMNRPDELLNGDLNIAWRANDRYERVSGNFYAVLTAPDSDTENESLSLSASTSAHHPQSFQELIPSHRSRTEDIVHKASQFRMSDSMVSKSPSQHHASGAVSHPPLPIRTQNLHSRGEAGSLPEQSTSAATSHGSMNDTRISEPSESHSSGYQWPMSIPDRSPHRTRDRPASTREIRYREIGFLGELFVFELFQRKIDDWTFPCWTSRLRVEAGHPRFIGRERDFSDFTYLDRYGFMKEALRTAGVEPNAGWSNNTTFHLEVKSTLGQCDEVFFVSQNQLDKMRMFDWDPNNAYVLLRVFNMEEGGSPGIKFFCDPWSLYMSRILEFRSEEGYKVYEGEGPEAISFRADVEES